MSKMLYRATLILALVAVAVCKDNWNVGLTGDWERNPFRLHKTSKLLNPVQTVGSEHGCCLPDEMEAFLGLLLVDEKLGSKLIVGVINYYWDVVNDKAFSDATLQIGDQVNKAKIWQDYRKNVLYVDYTGVACFKYETLPQPWASQCIPAGTKVLYDVYFGLNEMESTWYELVNKKGDFAFVSFTKPSKHNICVPVTLVASGIQETHAGGRAPYHYVIDFMNITSEIKDRSVFKIPRKCLVADVQNISARNISMGPLPFFL